MTTLTKARPHDDISGLDGLTGTATISRDEQYRYDLTRPLYDRRLPDCIFIGLNPSTADAKEDDPTIRRCKGFALSWGCGRLVMLNLFAFRATSPNNLFAAKDPIGPRNNSVLRGWLAKPDIKQDIVVCAWGVHGSFMDQDLSVPRLIRDAGHQPFCLGLTKDGHPRHPLYLRKDTKLIPFNRARGDG